MNNNDSNDINDNNVCVLMCINIINDNNVIIM